MGHDLLMDTLREEVSPDVRPTDAGARNASIFGGADGAHARIPHAPTTGAAPNMQQMTDICLRALRLQREGREMDALRLIKESTRTAVAASGVDIDWGTLGHIPQESLDRIVAEDLARCRLPLFIKTARRQDSLASATPQEARVAHSVHCGRHPLDTDIEVADAIMAERAPISMAPQVDDDARARFAEHIPVGAGAGHWRGRMREAAMQSPKSAPGPDGAPYISGVAPLEFVEILESTANPPSPLLLDPLILFIPKGELVNGTDRIIEKGRRAPTYHVDAAVYKTCGFVGQRGVISTRVGEGFY